MITFDAGLASVEIAESRKPQSFPLMAEARIHDRAWAGGPGEGKGKFWLLPWPLCKGATELWGMERGALEYLEMFPPYVQFTPTF